MRQPIRRGSSWPSSALILLLLVPACSAQDSSAQPLQADGTTAAQRAEFPVTVSNCGRSLTFDEPPERVVSLWQAPTEMLLALGVQDRLAAVGGSYAPLPEELTEAAEGVPAIGDSMNWPSREVLLTQAPDLVVSQLLEGFAFDTSLGYASVEEIEEGGAQVYSANSCDVAGNRDMTLETVSDSLRDLAAIFGRTDRAEELVGELEAQQKEVTEAVAGLPKVRVAYYNRGEGPMTVLTGGIYSDAITAAGGESVFPADALQVSAEEFAASGAEVILVGTYPGQDFQAQREFLTATFPELPAVQDGRIAEVPVVETDASVRVMDGLTRIAAALHPEAGLAAPGS